MLKTKNNSVTESNAPTLSPGFLDTLQSLMESGRLEEVVRDTKEEMKRKEIIENHRPKIKQISNGNKGLFWYTNVKDPVTGKVHPIRKVNKKDVENALVAWYEKTAGLAADSSMEDLYDRWHEERCRTHPNNTSYRDTTQYNRWLKGKKIVMVPMKDLTVPDIRDFLIDLAVSQKKNEKPMTMKQCKAVKSLISSFFDYAVEQRIVKYNLAKHAPLPDSRLLKSEEQKADTEMVYLPETINDIADKAYWYFGKTKNTAYLALILNTYLGLRVGELSALKPSDFDFQKAEVKINRAEIVRYRRENGKDIRDGLDIGLPKKSKQRVVPLCEAAIEMVNYILKQNELLGRGSEWLFTRSDGCRITADGINQALRRVCKKANVSVTGLHTIRRTFASEMIQSQKFTLKEVSRALGHSQISTTMDSYAFLMTDSADRAKRMDNVLPRIAIPS